MSNLKEYIVTLKNREDLDSFYDDMETPGGNLYIPDRAVDLVNRRPNSRNTHYMLSSEEAEQVRQDSRVLAVELLPIELGLSVRPTWTETSSFWSKDPFDVATHRNWALLRCTEGVQRSNWGSDGTTDQTATVSITAEGRNVDVVIVDGHIDPSHPEYAVNNDGSGGTRVIQYNWFQHNSTVYPANPSSSYTYTPYSTGFNDLTNDNNHGAHVAGTVAGNTQGWARSANIYNISPYSTNPNSFDALYIFDYIRAFHNTKAVNPSTGRRNPTIINNSWGYGYDLPISNLTSYRFQGTTVSGTPSAATLTSIGVRNNGINFLTPARYPALDADLEDAIADGIIVVGAASNDYMKISVTGDLDYNNYIVYGITPIFYHRGSSPTSTDGAICVGAVSALVNETKATFSNCGPRVDLFAPGFNILSSVNSTISYGGVADSRNGSYNLAKIQGTSMASPQVCGVLACVLETYPYMTQAEALAYIVQNATINQMTDTNGGLTDYTDLQGAPNRYLFLYKERQSTGSVYPKRNYKLRPSAGMSYPRPKIRRTNW